MCTENMELYEKFRNCPADAQKPIAAGRLKGKTDINPMWRIKQLTEAFGPCGFGWLTKIKRTWIEEGNGGERTANVEIALKVKYNGEWSEEIPGIGGSMFVENESKGPYTDDECFKKAYTDAISVACKALGIAANIYYAKDPDSKYSVADSNIPPAPAPAPTPAKSKYMTIKELLVGKSIDMNAVSSWIQAKWHKEIMINDLTDEQFGQLKRAVEEAK